MGKRGGLCLTVLLFGAFLGCGKVHTNMPKIKEEMETEEFQLEISSSVEQGECYICGEREDSLMPYYAKRDSIGIVHWNQPAVTD